MFGSYLAFSYPLNPTTQHPDYVCMRSLDGEFDRQEQYFLLLLDEAGEALKYETTACPWEMRLCSPQRELKLCYQDEETVRLYGNAGIEIKKEFVGGFTRVFCREENRWEMAGSNNSFMIEVNRGMVMDQSVWSEAGKGCEHICFQIFPDQEGILDLTIRRFDITCHPIAFVHYEKAVKDIRKMYETDQKRWKIPQDEYAETTELAVYTTWSSVISPRGHVKHPTILMSKLFMNFVWSWDYNFNALALYPVNESLAWAQFDTMITHQDGDGAFPDCFNAVRLSRSFVKPPIQGFILLSMMNEMNISDERIQILYESEKRHTNWWLNFRLGKNNIPVYYHGNDSGWDNGTVFSQGVPVQSPDSCTWLIFQMEFLAQAAQRLGMVREAAYWQEERDKMGTALFTQLTAGGRFVARKTGAEQTTGQDSLLTYVPLLLGDKVPKAIRDTMLTELMQEDRFLTAFGPVSEALDSLFFEEDGYWRGAIWPPMVYIVCEVLKRNNQLHLAAKTARNYCNLCRQSGFAENYSGLTGAAQCDGTYTWASSVYLILYREYVKEKPEENRCHEEN